MPKTPLMQILSEHAFEPRDAASLVFFRVTFGLILLWEAIRFFVNGLIDSVYLEPRFHFTYLGFGWVRPLPEEWLTLHFVLLGVAALLLTLGMVSHAAPVTSGGRGSCTGGRCRGAWAAIHFCP